MDSVQCVTGTTFITLEYDWHSRTKTHVAAPFFRLKRVAVSLSSGAWHCLSGEMDSVQCVTGTTFMIGILGQRFLLLTWLFSPFLQTIPKSLICSAEITTGGVAKLLGRFTSTLS